MTLQQVIAALEALDTDYHTPDLQPYINALKAEAERRERSCEGCVEHRHCCMMWFMDEVNGVFRPQRCEEYKETGR